MNKRFKSDCNKFDFKNDVVTQHFRGIIQLAVRLSTIH
jgi:hypothetical protein